MIVIISAPDDVHAQAVMKELDGQGVRGVRLLNLSEFPMQMDLALRLDDRRPADFALRLADGTRLALDEVTAFWWRRPQPFRLPASVKDPVHQHFAQSEAATAFQGMWQASRALWVNDIFRDAAAAHKPWQLALARRVGLSIPETLITNSPDEARHFWAAHPDGVIYKPFSASAYAWRETRLLKPTEQSLAEAVRLAPVIFQEYIPAHVDLRITAIGPRLFPAEAHTPAGEYPVDVRFNSKLVYKPHHLPEEVERKLLLFMRALGLEYGAIDMRLTPEGRYVFLEVNPAGQFLYVEMAAGIPISAALAEHIARGEPTPINDEAAGLASGPRTSRATADVATSNGQVQAPATAPVG